ncbi:hypothetical protein ACJIZ3_019443 [Penstemon smallii]|uniref:ZCF37 n=1 Tax=Penstemon smallii TaxID=265156 RepID=A0ABD3T1X2_9LAMI
MAPPMRKERDQKRRRRIGCFFPGGCCFGFREERDHNNSDGDAKLLLFKKEAAETIKSTGGKVVPAPPPPAHRDLVINKKDIFLEKIKSLEESVITDTIKSQSKKQNDMTREILSDPKKLSHSISMPLPRHKKEKSMGGGGGGREKGNEENELMIVGEFEPKVGALIIMVTLIVMLIWGKVCAILCTAAWYYFLPRFRANYVMKLENGSKQIDFDSPEYKKKVVLQGFLERNQQT